MFRLNRVTRERGRERERDPRPNRTLWIPTFNNPQLITDRLRTFSKFVNFYISKFRILVGWCHLAKLWRHLSRIQNSLFSFTQSNLWQDMNRFCLYLGLPGLVVRVLAWTYQYDISAQRFLQTWQLTEKLAA